MNYFFRRLFLCLIPSFSYFLAGFASLTLPQSLLSQGVAQDRVYELRTYTCQPGKLQNLLSRFRDHTLLMFEQYGMENIGYWIPMNEPLSENTLIYILEHQNVKAAEESFKAFAQSAEWKQIKAETEKDGPLLLQPPASLFLKKLSGSPEIGPPDAAKSYVWRSYHSESGRLEELSQAIQSQAFPLFAGSSIQVFGAFVAVDPVDAPDSVFMLFEFDSVQSGEEHVAQLLKNPEFTKLVEDLKRSGVLSDLESGSVWLKVADFSPVQSH